MNSALLRRAGVVTTLAAGFVLAVAGPAAAHVTVNPNTAAQGDYTKISFRVPNESDTASTTKVEVNLPTDTPIGSVALKPVPGWTGTAEKTKLTTPITTDDGQVTEAVTKITWTADASSAIKPGTFQEFDVSLGPLPDTDQVVFKALQTYSDGTVVRWIDEPAAAGAEEPENPAPVLTLTAASDSDASAAPAADGTDTEAADDSDSSGSSWGIAGLVAGLAGLVIGLLAYRKAAQQS